MSEEMRTPLKRGLSWEEWLRQGMLTPDAVARLQAISRRRLAAKGEAVSAYEEAGAGERREL